MQFGSKHHILDGSGNNHPFTKPPKSMKTPLNISKQPKSTKHMSTKSKINKDHGNNDMEDKSPSTPDSNATNASGQYNDNETEIEEVLDGKNGESEVWKDIEPGGNGMFDVHAHPSGLI